MKQPGRAESAVKDAYDPDNAFHLDRNIAPHCALSEESRRRPGAEPTAREDLHLGRAAERALFAAHRPVTGQRRTRYLIDPAVMPWTM